MKQKIAILAIGMVIAGFGMMHSARGIAEVISLLLIGAGSLTLIGMLIRHKPNDQK